METLLFTMPPLWKSPFAIAKLQFSIIPTENTLSYDFHAHQYCLFMFSPSKAYVGFAHETPQSSGKFTPRSFLLYRTKMTFRLKYSNVLDFNSSHINKLKFFFKTFQSTFRIKDKRDTIPTDSLILESILQKKSLKLNHRK